MPSSQRIPVSIELQPIRRKGQTIVFSRLISPFMDQPESARRLLGQMALWWLAFTLGGTFVHAFLYRSTSDPMVSVTYSLTSYVGYVLICPLGGLLLKRMDPLKVWRIGTTAYALVYTTFLLVGTSAGQHPVLLGLLNCVSLALYWPAHHLLIYRLTGASTRAQFTALSGFLMTLSGMVVPPVAGILVASAGVDWGYRTLFGGSLLLFAASIAASLKHGSLPVVPRGFMLIEASKRALQHPLWGRSIAMHILLGIREGLLIFLPSLLVFIASGSEGALGSYTLLVNLLSTSAFYAAGWVYRGRIRALPLSIAAGVLTVAPLLLWLDNGLTSLLLFSAAGALATPFLSVAFGTQAVDLMQSDPVSREQPQEYQTLREMTVIGGRCLTIAAFVWLAPQPDSLREISKILLVSSAAVVPATWLLVSLSRQTPK